MTIEMEDRVTFVICTERGILERKSRVLVESLRTFGGRFASSRVLSYSPREGRIPRDETLEFLSGRDVEVILDPLNRDLVDYGFANKVVACAHAEEALDHDRLVFLDSDTLVLREPGEVWTREPGVIRVRPVERKLAGSSGSDEHADYWKRILEWAGVSDPTWVNTTLTGERIYGYWNAGVVAGPCGSAFFRRWFRTLRALVRQDLVHPGGMTFMDQVALALTIHHPDYRLEHLPRGYNVPVNSLPKPEDDAMTDREIPDPGEVAIAHYHKAVDHYPLSNPLLDWIPPAKRARVSQFFRAHGLIGPVNWLRHRLDHRLGWDFLAP